MKNNILLLLTDQQRWDALGAAGNPFVKTPNLDRLACEGVLFSSAYSNCPVCVPARAALLYGRSPLTTGCLENRYAMPDERQYESLMTRLVRAGYRTHGIGKMHFTPDPHALRGFQSRATQEEMVTDASKDDYLCYLKENGCDYAIEPHGVRGEAYYVPQLSNVPPQHHPTKWVGDRTVEWLKSSRSEVCGLQSEVSEAQAFFLMSSFIHPHPPFSPPTPWHKLYRGPDMPLPKFPEGMESLYTYTNRQQNRYKGRDAGRDLRLHQLIKAYYWASVSFVDYQVGRILQALEETGQLDNTLIIFTSDHGEFLGDYNCFGKRSFLDSAARIPMLCRLPGRFAAGEVCSAPVSLLDVLPTALSAAEVDAEDAEGLDMAGLADGSLDRQAVYGHYREADAGMYMAVSEEWKYIWSAPDNKEFLFDRSKDPDELRNRAYNVACREPAARMRTLLQEHVRSFPGMEAIVDGNGWVRKEPIHLPDDPDAGLIFQDAPCFSDRMWISGYSEG